MELNKLYFETLRLLCESGRDFSLEDLGSSLGVKKQSLYSYAKSKEELIRKALLFYSDRLKISEFEVDFSKEAEDILSEIIEHYVSLFSKEENRYYLAYIWTLAEYSSKSILNLEDIKYTIEKQVFFILEEIRERKKIQFLFESSFLAHILMLLILDIVQLAKDEEVCKFEREKLQDFFSSIIKK